MPWSKRKINIEAAIRILRKETRKFKVPIVSLIALGASVQKPFLVLISCLLSLRTKDETTAVASERLFNLAGSPQEMLSLSVRQIEKAIYPVGFYRVKAKRIKEICRALIGKFSSRVPDSLEDLLTLKGVGRKTANLVLTEGFGKLGVCVDTHVHRITNRLGLCRTKNPQQTEFCLRNKLPKRYWIEYNTLLVTWGQNICKPVSPLCTHCAIERYCRRIAVTTYR
ncbi:MAG TPA: endonuclease III [Candidatus Omnitrophica bacterium]|nr:endonuclease III [Candidatus Omnitrophota bacterium]